MKTLSISKESIKALNLVTSNSNVYGDREERSRGLTQPNFVLDLPKDIEISRLRIENHDKEVLQCLVGVRCFEAHGNPVMEITPAEVIPIAFRRLVELHLDKCKLTKVPDWISSLPAITLVRLTSNKLKDLPKWFMEIRPLTTVHAENNAFKDGCHIFWGTVKTISLNTNKGKGKQDKNHFYQKLSLFQA